MDKLLSYLEGGDLRSIGQVDLLVPLIKTQTEFDRLFQYLHSKDRLVMMRAADAVEKITMTQPQFLTSHKQVIIDFLKTASDKEFKWHLALLVSRLDITKAELPDVWNTLISWARDSLESKIVRVNSIQSLHDIAKSHPEFHQKLNSLIDQIKAENIPSINARLKKLK